jgi:hypothetical protein
MLLTVAPDDPVFMKVTESPEAGVSCSEYVTSEIRAVLVNDPNRPNTKPATAMAAMRVMAMRMTVARTGEMAFLFFLRTFSKFIVE